MKATEFIVEHKKGRKAVKHNTKPRNPVAHAAQTVAKGSGAHKDKKKAEKQGNVKHKKDLATMETVLRDKGDLQAKRKTLQDLSMNKDVDQKAVQQRKLDLEKEAKSKGMSEDNKYPFAGAKVGHKAGKAGQWRNDGPKKNKPAKAGDLVGGS
jgi:hypothetical protein